MKNFTRMHRALDSSPFHRSRASMLADYFRACSRDDAAWALYFLLGGQLKRAIPTATLRAWLMSELKLPEWLVLLCQEQVGDLAETLALLADLLPQAETIEVTDLTLAHWIENKLRPLQEASPEHQRESVSAWWRTLPLEQASMIHHLLSGRFQTPAPRRTIEEALALAYGLPRETISLRLQRQELESFSAVEVFQRVIAREELAPEQSELLFEKPANFDERSGLPFPFAPIQNVTSTTEIESDFASWLILPSYGGVRAQILRRAGECQIWIESSEGGAECVTRHFPELAKAAACLPDGTAVEGELVPTASVRKRLSQSKVSAKGPTSHPVSFRVQDMRSCQILLGPSLLLIAPEPLIATSHEMLEELQKKCRAGGALGLYFRHQREGRILHWAAPPLTVDAVLVYVETGYQGLSGFSFALWENESRDSLIQMARTPVEGLDPDHFKELEEWVRSNVRERFGPIRAVDPVQVFEIAFDELEVSPRHRAGVSLRAPRIVRWKKHTLPAQAASLKTLKEMRKLNSGQSGLIS